MLSSPLIERPILRAGGGYAGTMRGILPAHRVALHGARVRRGHELAAFALDRADPAERPRVGNGDVVTTAAQVGDHLVAESRLDGESTRREPARIERADQVVRVPLRRVDRLLQVEPAVDVADERVQRPLLLLVSPGGAVGEPRL